MRSVKDFLVNPFLSFVKRQTFSPNYITIASGILGLVGIAFSLYSCKWLAFAFYVVSRIFDGLDGAYARLTD